MEDNSQKPLATKLEDTQTSSVNESQAGQFQQTTTPANSLSSVKKPLIIVGILLGFVLFGIGGYLLGTQRNNNKVVVDSNVVPTNPPATTTQPSPTTLPTTATAIDPLKPNLVPMTNWKTVSFPQNVIVSQGGDSRPAKVEFKIPPSWSAEAIQAKTNEQIGGVTCKDFQIVSQDRQTVLVIRPDCGGSSPDYLNPDSSLQVVELTTKKGNDGHDSYTVRYASGTPYNYGEIGVSPGAKIDLAKDKIYPHLILQYEPDRMEQWLWTSIDLTYSGVIASKQTALSTADTIVSTLKLID